MHIAGKPLMFEVGLLRLSKKVLCSEPGEIMKRRPPSVRTCNLPPLGLVVVFKSPLFALKGTRLFTCAESRTKIEAERNVSPRLVEWVWTALNEIQA